MRSATGADLGLTTVATVTGTNAYTHYRQSFVTPANAATITVMLALPAGDSGRAFFDDVRLISNNRLVDASFELRAKDGTRSSGWEFVRGGAFAEAADARSGRSCGLQLLHHRAISGSTRLKAQGTPATTLDVEAPMSDNKRGWTIVMRRGGPQHGN